ncbi:hypothetical protein TNCV_3883291 [Trichonephila clavipes]|nr:hypothetical protein TNCV_3883291 [Trichonephila clavipes]
MPTTGVEQRQSHIDSIALLPYNTSVSNTTHSQWGFAFGRVYSEMKEKWVSGSRVHGYLRAMSEKLNSAHMLLAPSIVDS